MNKGRLIRQVLIIGFGVPLLIFLGAFVVHMLGSTLVNPWVPLGCSAGVALISGLRLAKVWQKLLSINNIYICFIINALVMTGVVSALILALNYYSVSDSSRHVVRGEVSRVYTRTRHTSRRVSRRVYVQGRPYKVYFIELQLPDEREGAAESICKEMEISYSCYSGTHKNDSIEVEIGKGILGMPVIYAETLRNLTPKSKKRRKYNPQSVLRH